MTTPKDSHREAIETATIWIDFAEKAAINKSSHEQAAQKEHAIMASATAASNAWQDVAKAAIAWLAAEEEVKVLEGLVSGYGEVETRASARVIEARQSSARAQAAWETAKANASKVETEVKKFVTKRPT